MTRPDATAVANQFASLGARAFVDAEFGFGNYHVRLTSPAGRFVRVHYPPETPEAYQELVEELTDGLHPCAED